MIGGVAQVVFGVIGFMIKGFAERKFVANMLNNLYMTKKTAKLYLVRQ